MASPMNDQIIVKCELCGVEDEIDAASLAGWTPAYFLPDGKQMGCACHNCIVMKFQYDEEMDEFVLPN